MENSILDCDCQRGEAIVIVDQSFRAVGASHLRLSSIRRVCLCHFSTTHPGYHSFVFTSDCGLQTSGEDELSQPHQGHFCWTGGQQWLWYVTDSPSFFHSCLFSSHLLNYNINTCLILMLWQKEKHKIETCNLPTPVSPRCINMCYWTLNEIPSRPNKVILILILNYFCSQAKI